MQIFQVQQAQNQNTTFEAYFKKDTAGYLKNLYKKSQNIFEIAEKSKLLKETCPNHQLEIIGAKYQVGTEANPRVDWREATRSMWMYNVKNNDNGQTLWISTPAKENHLSQLLTNLVSSYKDCTQNCGAKSFQNFWRNKARDEKILEELTTPLNNQTKSVYVEHSNYDKLPLKERIKSFVNFWLGR